MLKKKVLAVATLGLVSFANLVYAGDTLKLGEDLTITDKTKVSDVLANPENYLGKTVLIEGKITDVCTKRGCWLKVSSDKKKQKIVVKVQDGEMVFPLEARGKTAKIEGVLYKAEEEEQHQHEYEEKHNHEHQSGKEKEHKHKHDHKMKKKATYMFKPTAVVIE